MTTTITAAGERHRDPLQALPVMDGPFRGKDYANHDDAFYVAQINAPASAPARVLYRLRRHAALGLVWASEDSPALTAPYQD
ncbi:hypothetical protein D3C77_412090 [compost metagenome]